MTNGLRRVAGALLALLVTLLTGFGVAAPAQASAAIAPSVAAQADCGDTSSYTVVALSSLPAQATDTYNLIQQGGPYPYDQDGTVFQNREGLLPACSTGYYHEYTVVTPGSSTRGTRRIITGEGGEYFYTGDHYESFQLIDVNS
ncbi:ribonuclease domain-containing protein [Amycolatopsis sp.]|uniref:ribonuclease domain-containing protein n=1 Tax=Amycolatopsis sp. TaxID=37632 RepID=UPI002C85C9DD|nr:ribonuclease domain-containing protein [Amycolatopsis sp.]HVV13799.1 ribonuclease domain-containing protein [Amycolatopsis sp.]